MEYGVTMMVNASPLENPSISLRDPAVFQELWGGGTTDAGVSVTSTTAMGYPPLWRAINLISGHVAKLPCDVYKRNGTGKEKDRLHPAWRLLHGRASPSMSSLDWLQTQTAHAIFRGNGYGYIARNNRRDPVEILLLSPVDTFPAIVNGALWYVTYIDGDQMRFPARDVIHIKGLSSDGMVGYDVLSIMKEALGVGMAAQSFGARFFGSGSNLSGVLMVPGHFSEEKIRNTMSAWNTMSQGMKNSHKVALLQDGSKFQPYSVPPDSAQFLETRQYEIRGTVANITGCPPHKLGDDTRTSHNSLEAENQSLLDDCLDLWLCKWEQELSDKLLSETQKLQDSHFVEFNRNALLRMSSQDRAAYYSKLQEHGNLTINDVLGMESMPSIGPKGDRRYRPGNLVEIGDTPDAERQTVPEPQQPQTPNTEADAMLRAMVASSVTKALTIERDRVIKAAKTEGNFVAWMDRFYPQWVMNATIPIDGAADVLRDHSARSQAALLDVAGSATTDTLAGAVAECVATWDHADTLTQRILGDG